jgi:molybdopterin molybdotransferase
VRILLSEVVLQSLHFVNFDGKKVGSSAILTNMLKNSALMISGEEDKNLEAGTYVNVITLESF